MNKVILFYQYTEITDLWALRVEQRELCQQLGLKGRIWIAQEGINGTLAGPMDAVDNYIASMRHDKRFADVDFKQI